ncbi:DUF4142 domain-containing protein [Polyangium spumosum]|nr:DUF4142 domain-containing protein [Polyangium spumosum]
MPHGIHRSLGRAFALFVLAFAGAAGCGTDAGERPGQAAEEPSEPLTHGQILAVVSTLDQGEIAAADNARIRASDNAVRTYAQRILADHKEAETRIQVLQAMLRVQQEGSELQADVRRQSEQAAELLRQTPDAQFNATYLDTQIGMHQRTITLFDAQLIPQAESLELQTFLRDLREELTKHLALARYLRKRYPTPPGGGI